MGTASVEAVKVPLVPGMQKTSSPGRKTVPGLSRGGTNEREGEETNRFENRPTWLQQDRLGTSLVVCRCDQAARLGVCGRASLKVAYGDHLNPRPDSDGEGARAGAQDHVGAVVEWLEGWNQTAPTDPDKGGGEQLGWQLAGP
jgi:hypothetical protein